SVDRFGGFFLPFALALATALAAWIAQTAAAYWAYRRIIYPEIRRNPLANYLIGWVAIATHELGHAVVAAVTGSKIEEVEITTTRGHVKSITEVSLLGWLSLALSSLAPTFLPPLLFLAAFYYAFPGALELNWTTLEDIANANASNIITISSSLADLANPISLALLYFLIVLAPTAGPSAGDVRNVLEQTVRRPFALLVLLVVLAVLFYTFEALNFPVTNPIIWALTLSFLVVLLGLALATALALYLREARSMPGWGVAASLLAFALSYAAARLGLIPEFAEPARALALAALVEVLVLLVLPKERRF
ncbi:MAG: hypothetical protein QXH27_05190, partial [Candidatus Micrarchaeia archaeon]